jgi:murein L,D-transpeptidase YafK
VKGSANETKRDKFVRLAEARTNKIIDTLQLLGNCSNTSAYEYTQQDVDQIFAAIETEVREAKKKFSRVESPKSAKFTLK